MGRRASRITRRPELIQVDDGVTWTRFDGSEYFAFRKFGVPVNRDFFSRTSRMRLCQTVSAVFTTVPATRARKMTRRRAGRAIELMIPCRRETAICVARPIMSYSLANDPFCPRRSTRSGPGAHAERRRSWGFSSTKAKLTHATPATNIHLTGRSKVPIWIRKDLPLMVGFR